MMGEDWEDVKLNGTLMGGEEGLSFLLQNPEDVHVDYRDKRPTLLHLQSTRWNPHMQKYFTPMDEGMYTAYKYKMVQQPLSTVQNLVSWMRKIAETCGCARADLEGQAAAQEDLLFLFRQIQKQTAKVDGLLDYISQFPAYLGQKGLHDYAVSFSTLPVSILLKYIDRLVVTGAPTDLIQNVPFLFQDCQTWVSPEDCANYSGDLSLIAIPNVLGDFDRPEESFLHQIIEANEDENEDLQELMKSKPIAALLDFKWDTYCSNVFLLEFIVYLFFLALFVYVALTVPETPPKSMWVSHQILILCVGAYLLGEFQQVYVEGLNYWIGPDAVWNYFDLVLVGSIFGMMIIIYNERHPVWTYTSVASLLVWVRLLYYGLGFEVTGLFVRTLFQITLEISSFLLMLLILILGFAQAWFVLFGRGSLLSHLDDPEGSGFTSFPMAVLTVYRMMVGENPDVNVVTVNIYSLAYFLIFSMLVPVILINMLIAKMNDSYAARTAQAEGEFRLAQAKRITEYESATMARLFIQGMRFLKMIGVRIALLRSKASAGTKKKQIMCNDFFGTWFVVANLNQGTSSASQRKILEDYVQPAVMSMDKRLKDLEANLKTFREATLLTQMQTSKEMKTTYLSKTLKGVDTVRESIANLEIQVSRLQRGGGGLTAALHQNSKIQINSSTNLK
eukprot:Platyproteum_vivax@DN6634_c0_g1_i1.p1